MHILRGHSLTALLRDAAVLLVLTASGCERTAPAASDVEPDVEVGLDSRPVVPPCTEEPVAMVRVYPGAFTAGSPPTEVGRDENEAQRSVTLTHGFCMAVTEVTQASFLEVMGTNPSTDAGCGAECPVEGVTWHAAAQYANALSARGGLEACYTCSGGACVAAGNPYVCEGYRLPTEAEWEYAARAGASAAFPNGEELVEGEDARCVDPATQGESSRPDDVAAVCTIAGASLQPVGGLAPNAWGLHDVCGNVWEWCHDAYLYDVGSLPSTDPVSGEKVEDPRGPGAVPGDGGATLAWQRRSVRGGSYMYYPRFARLGYRSGTSPETAFEDLGFRVVRSLR